MQWNGVEWNGMEWHKLFKEMLEERREADKFILAIDTWFEKFLGV